MLAKLNLFNLFSFLMEKSKHSSPQTLPMPEPHSPERPCRDPPPKPRRMESTSAAPGTAASFPCPAPPGARGKPALLDGCTLGQNTGVSASKKLCPKGSTLDNNTPIKWIFIKRPAPAGHVAKQMLLLNWQSGRGKRYRLGLESNSGKHHRDGSRSVTTCGKDKSPQLSTGSHTGGWGLCGNRLLIPMVQSRGLTKPICPLTKQMVLGLNWECHLSNLQYLSTLFMILRGLKWFVGFYP